MSRSVFLSVSLLLSFGMVLEVSARELPKQQIFKISEYAANFLLNKHYVSKELDDELSEKLLAKYIESLDSKRMIFLQKDIELFSFTYGKKLDDSFLKHPINDLLPAQFIFNMYK